MIVVAGCTAVCAQQITDGSGNELPQEERAAILRLGSEGLKDPQSANFTKVVRARRMGACGYVNAKNSYGGYVGARMFYSNVAQNQFFILPTGAELWSYSAAELDNVQKMIPAMQANCLTDSGNPIM